MLAAGSASAEVTVAKGETWDAYVSGRVGAFLSYAFGEGRPMPKVAGSMIEPGGGVDNEDIVVHAVPRKQAPAWLMRKQAEGYELDLKLWAGLWMLEHNPDGTRLEG